MANCQFGAEDSPANRFVAQDLRSRFEVQSSRFKVRWMLDVGCWMWLRAFRQTTGASGAMPPNQRIAPFLTQTPTNAAPDLPWNDEKELGNPRRALNKIG
jgi:hypothetical protein